MFNASAHSNPATDAASGARSGDAGPAAGPGLPAAAQPVSGMATARPHGAALADGVSSAPAQARARRASTRLSPAARRALRRSRQRRGWVALLALAVLWPVLWWLEQRDRPHEALAVARIQPLADHDAACRTLATPGAVEDVVSDTLPGDPRACACRDGPQASAQTAAHPEVKLADLQHLTRS